MKRCGLCNKVKFKLPHAVVYSIVDEDGLPEEQTMSICKKCAAELDKHARDRKKEK